MGTGHGSQKVMSSQQTSGFQAIVPGVCQKVSYTNVSAASSTAFTKSIVRVTATTDCFIKFGASPTALTDGTCVFLPNGAIEYFGVNRGDKVAAIRLASSGDLYVTEGA